MGDAYDLSRFIAAQEGVFPRALAELQAGEKRSHWMWFIFPQIAGLGSSPMARLYAIASLDEARAYLGHRLLGPRLRACTDAVNAVSGRSVHAIFGAPDDMKFRSSMTLFNAAAPDEPSFAAALAQYFAGSPDPLTLRKLGPD
ncbi:DUF1810 domain-containing protein [Methylobacterium mesophilicum SR1.6/6]|uniref:DUF1810 domain-containing protein n=1 Tax=Methylobacterium mesophilicum SR1.6/6 TaxID=908290 RepID=A0A6B9FFV2_9HYPH|nr:DUF1810 domain-containing protein [Methylobacterium mesophilicum]QGY01142.1 DUF1810 domain-containing protein [Methylobacterium mesophilicum SR1.6/6]